MTGFHDFTGALLRIFRSGIAPRLLLSSGEQDNLEELTKRFDRFKKQFNRGISAQSGVTSEMLLELIGTDFTSPSKRSTYPCVSELAKNNEWLDKLKPQDSVRGDPTAECMDGTREDIIAEIDDLDGEIAALRGDVVNPLRRLVAKAGGAGGADDDPDLEFSHGSATFLVTILSPSCS